MKYLSISNDIKLPIDAATQTTAIVARKRVGKTYTASVQAEEFIKADIPIVVLDPTGAWWGLRSSADGKKDGYPVVIIGGSHADVPLEETAGKVVADLVVDKPGFYVIDFSQIETDAAIHRFATDFAKRFYFRKEEHRFPIVLFVDEADVFIPQNPFGEEKRMLHSFDVIVRRGGIRGIGVVLITQRPAVLHKNVLTQCETLITLQISGSQDIDALQHWTRVHGTKEQREEYYSTVSSLEIGEAWIWSPSWLRVFKRIRIRRRETFNSSATPKVGEKAIVPKRLAPVDLENLSKSIKETIQKAKENDPDALRKKVIELQSLVKKLESQKPKAELSADEKERIIDQARMEFKRRIEAVSSALVMKHAIVGKTVDAIRDLLDGIAKIEYPSLIKEFNLPVEGIKTVQNYSKNIPTPPQPKVSTQVVQDGEVKLPSGAVRMVAAAVQWKDNGISATMMRTQAAIKHPVTFGDYRNRITKAGFIVESNGLFYPTQQGIDFIGNDSQVLPTSTEAVMSHWMKFFPDGCKRIMSALIAHKGESVSKEQLMDESSIGHPVTFNDYKNRLKSVSLLIESNGQYAANKETLFL